MVDVPSTDPDRTPPVLRKLAFASALVVGLGCAAASADFTVPPPPGTLSPDPIANNGARPATLGAAIPSTVEVPIAPQDNRIQHPPINPVYLPTSVPYHGSEPAGTIIIDTGNRFLYLVQDGGWAIRYGVGVGRPGFEWSGVHSVTRKAEWPDWRPPAEMREREPWLPDYVPGGPANPLGARALYLGSTLYRIHGSNEPWTIGQAVSSGCIRMRNEDVIDLYGRVSVGTRVIVL